MSIVQNPLIGKTRKSAGNMTFAIWKGINVLKTKPVSVANPKTAAQTSQRQKLKNAVKFFRTISDIANVGFQQQAVKQSAYNAFVSDNIKGGVFSNTPENVIANIALLKLAKGTLNQTENVAIDTASVANSVVITWDNSVSGDQRATDTINVLITTNQGYVRSIEIGAAQRSAGELTIPYHPWEFSPCTMNVFVFFSQAGTRKVSDSLYLSAATV